MENQIKNKGGRPREIFNEKERKNRIKIRNRNYYQKRKMIKLESKIENNDEKKNDN